MSTAQDGARVDQALVARGLARSRATAQECIAGGRVLRNGETVMKASERVTDDDTLEVSGEPERYPGRAAHKLAHALQVFADLSVAGRRALDVGASTGGFTQVLLETGAREVVALDVGHGQLVERLRSDPRVIERSGLSIRDVDRGDLGPPFDLVVADLSFISLRLVVQRMAQLLAPTGDLVVLVKPQFEVGRGRVGKGGVVRSGHLRADAVQGVLDSAGEAGLQLRRLTASPVTGEQGNQEYLLWLRRESGGMMTPMQIADELAKIRTVRS